ncbi:MAG: cupin [Opitutales bacterium]|nr:cupin [Opitutales bacterium]
MGAGGREFESLRPDQFSSVTAEEVIEKLRLERHPEGGWFRRTYQSRNRLHLARGERFAGTCIYYLLEGEEHSALHRLRSDETWFFHAGCGLVVHLFGENVYEKKRLGANLSAAEDPQLTIPAGTIFAAELTKTSAWCLIGCSVCPGFDFTDFSWANLEELRQRFPKRCELIDRLKA